MVDICRHTIEVVKMIILVDATARVEYLSTKSVQQVCLNEVYIQISPTYFVPFLKDAKKQMRAEVHVERPILPAPCKPVSNNSTLVVKEEPKPTVCDTNVPVSNPVSCPIEMKKKKWAEKVIHVTMVTSFHMLPFRYITPSFCCNHLYLIVGLSLLRYTELPNQLSPAHGNRSTTNFTPCFFTTYILLFSSLFA